MARKMIIETKRLLLREFTLQDTDALAAIYADPVGMASKGGPRPYGYARHTIEEAIRDYATYGYGFWATVLKDDDKLIGLCGLLNQIVMERPEVEVAYTLAKEYWGLGLATEAAQSLIEYAFKHLPVPRLVSLIASTNIPSQRVAVKNGMVHETTLEKASETSVYVYVINKHNILKI